MIFKIVLKTVLNISSDYEYRPMYTISLEKTDHSWHPWRMNVVINLSIVISRAFEYSFNIVFVNEVIANFLTSRSGNRHMPCNTWKFDSFGE